MIRINPGSVYGDSPLGRPTLRAQRLATLDATKELLECLGAFLHTDPTKQEIEMVDTIINAMTWSKKGYETVEDLARACYKVMHNEEPTWKCKE